MRRAGRALVSVGVTMSKTMWKNVIAGMEKAPSSGAISVPRMSGFSTMLFAKKSATSRMSSNPTVRARRAIPRPPSL